MDYTHRFHSPMGEIVMASDGDSLVGLWFIGQKNFAETLSPANEERNLPVFELTDRWLEAYFHGNAPDFTPPLTMRTTPFRKAVWNILLGIPFGSTMTYGDIAGRIATEKGRKMSPQAVGGAVGHNAISLISPCHRVLGADGSLTGYAGGMDRKAHLLQLEGIKVQKLFFLKEQADRFNPMS